MGKVIKNLKSISKKLVSSKRIVFLFIVTLGIYLIVQNFGEQKLSPDQKNIIKLFGDPYQFIITYTPQGEVDNPKLARDETWVYPVIGKKVYFLAGKFMGSDDYEAAGNIDMTSLKPEDFKFDTSYSDMERLLGANEIVPLNDIPGLYEENQMATYASKTALFIIENGYLTYFQTLSSIPSNEVTPDPTEIPTSTPTPTPNPTDMNSWQTHEDTDLKFFLKFPSDWYFPNDSSVLTNMNLENFSDQLIPPQGFIKCDANIYDPEDVSIQNGSEIISSDIKVTKGIAKDETGFEGPGLGAGIIYLIKDNKHAPISFICYFFDESRSEIMKNIFSTFKFIN